jgi:hypothetical protein
MNYHFTARNRGSYYLELLKKTLESNQINSVECLERILTRINKELYRKKHHIQHIPNAYHPLRKHTYQLYATFCKETLSFYVNLYDLVNTHKNNTPTILLNKLATIQPILAKANPIKPLALFIQFIVETCFFLPFIYLLTEHLALKQINFYLSLLIIIGTMSPLCYCYRAICKYCRHTMYSHDLSNK